MQDMWHVASKLLVHETLVRMGHAVGVEGHVQQHEVLLGGSWFRSPMSTRLYSLIRPTIPLERTYDEL